MKQPLHVTLRAFTVWSWLAALCVPAVLAAMFFFLLKRGLPGLDATLFFGDTPVLAAIVHGAPVFDGIWPACLGTLTLVALATMLAVPFGVASGVYLAEMASGRCRAFLSLGIELLAGVPSILMGLFGFALILLLRRSVAPEANTGLLLSAGCLALLVLPYIVHATRLALESLPANLRLTGASLGLTTPQTLVRILLPAALPGLFSGIVLAVGRIAEDTAVILLTGAVANAGAPGSLTGKFEALSFTIYYRAAEYQTPDGLAQAFAVALVLLCLTGLLTAFARAVQAGLASASDTKEAWS